MTTTKYLQLPIPSKSDRGKIITECLDPAFTKMDQKIESIDSNIDFNLLATLGIPYGGILNNTNAKVAGTAYYDTANKKIYKCTTNTSINYADAGYFIEVSNNDLLGKLQNLKEKLVNFVGEINTNGTVMLQTSLNSSFTFINVEFSQSNSDVHTKIVRIPFEDRYKKFAVHGLSGSTTSLQEYCEVTFVGLDRVNYYVSNLDGINQCVAKKIWQSNL